jgi:hypothetical protein
MLQKSGTDNTNKKGVFGIPRSTGIFGPYVDQEFQNFLMINLVKNDVDWHGPCWLIFGMGLAKYRQGKMLS